MSQEAESQSFSLACSLDDAGNVSHDEGFVVAIGHHAEAWFHGGEGIVCNFGSCGRERGQQGGLTGVWEADESHVSEQFQFENHHHFLHGFSRLCIARCLVCGSSELEVAESAASPFEEHDDLSVFRHVADILSRFGVVSHGSGRYVNVFVFSIATV